MASTSNNFSCCGASATQQHRTMVSIPTLFVCGHSQPRTVSKTHDTPTVKISNGPCSSPSCQAKSSAGVCVGSRAALTDSAAKFIKTMTANFQLAGMSCEASLRQFSMAEPMLAEEMEAAGCTQSVVRALLGAAACDRSSATAAYLGNRSAQATLEQFKACVHNNGSQWAATTIANEVQTLHDNMQKNLIALQKAVFQLTRNSYPAPGLGFKMIEGIQSFEQGWGKTQLKMLRSTSEGMAILALPLSNSNILAAKTCILSASKELQALQNNERAAFFSDYPGTQALHANGQMKDACAMIAEQPVSDDMDVTFTLSKMIIDTAEATVSDIRALRPVRVLSTKMAQNTLGVDMGKVNAYTGKPLEILTNPWWSYCKQ